MKARQSARALDLGKYNHLQRSLRVTYQRMRREYTQLTHTIDDY